MEEHLRRPGPWTQCRGRAQTREAEREQASRLETILEWVGWGWCRMSITRTELKAYVWCCGQRKDLASSVSFLPPLTVSNLNFIPPSSPQNGAKDTGATESVRWQQTFYGGNSAMSAFQLNLVTVTGRDVRK